MEEELPGGDHLILLISGFNNKVIVAGRKVDDVQVSQDHCNLFGSLFFYLGQIFYPLSVFKGLHEVGEQVFFTFTNRFSHVIQFAIKDQFAVALRIKAVHIGDQVVS